MERIDSVPTTPPEQIIPADSFSANLVASQIKVNPTSEALRALAKAFPNVDAANMLSNLHQFLGSKHNYCIVGSTAMFIHACLVSKADRTFPSPPNDLDLVVNYPGMQRTEYMAGNTQEFGLTKEQSRPGRYHYTDPETQKTVRIDLIPESRQSFEPFLRNAQWVDDFQLASIDDLLEASKEQISSKSLSANGLTEEKRMAIQARLDYFEKKLVPEPPALNASSSGE